MHKDAQAYFDATQTATQTREDAVKELGSKYMVPMDYDRYAPEYNELRRQYLAERESFYEAERAAKAAAWGALKTSEHPVIKFMGEDCADYVQHVEQILRALPEDGSVDLVKLDKVASDGSWCGEWDRLLELAAKKDLLPADCKIATRRLNRLLDGSVDGYLTTSQVRKLRKLIEAATVEAVAEALEKAKAAPAKRTAAKRTTTRPANQAAVKTDTVGALVAEPATA